MAWVEQEFSAHLSHQLLSCAAKAQAIASVLEMQDGVLEQLPPELFQALAVLVKDLEHLGYRVLYFDQPVVSTSPLSVEPVDLAALIEETIKPYQLRVPDRPVIKCYQADLHYVQGSRTQLGIVLDNLISNAFKYSDPQSPITITTERCNGRVDKDGARMMISVANRGSFISPAEQELIFSKFYRGSNATQPGQGLGLHLARHLVELYGGQLEVESSPEEGTRFWFTLPLAAGQNGKL
jgi:signal transduction histidine kinase